MPILRKLPPDVEGTFGHLALGKVNILYRWVRLGDELWYWLVLCLFLKFTRESLKSFILYKDHGGEVPVNMHSINREGPNLEFCPPGCSAAVQGKICRERRNYEIFRFTACFAPKDL